MTLIYKICPAPLWQEAERAGVFAGAPVDLADGYIHFSTAAQVAETAAKHFAGQTDLLLVAVDDEALGTDLRYELSRGGALFPHLYGLLRLGAIDSVAPLQLGPDGVHVLPPLAEEVPGATGGFDPAREGWVPSRLVPGLIELVGPFWSKPEFEGRTHGFLAQERHLNSNRVVHGGMIMTFADHSLAIASSAATGGQIQATIQLDTQFVDAVRADDFVLATCRVVRQARSLMFMSGELTVGSRMVAAATGIWKLRAGLEEPGDPPAAKPRADRRTR